MVGKVKVQEAEEDYGYGIIIGDTNNIMHYWVNSKLLLKEEVPVYKH